MGIPNGKFGSKIFCTYGQNDIIHFARFIEAQQSGQQYISCKTYFAKINYIQVAYHLREIG